MEKIEFKVSAKAARLIGRENISDVDGALIELIKNAYDADASCVFIKLVMPFPSVPYNTTISHLRNYFSEEEIKKALDFYDITDEKISQKRQLTDLQKEELQKIFFQKNMIIVIDNGIGMPRSVIETSWMHIGTSDKEVNIYSDKGRVKTGAKGIGRFALDKLSLQTRVLTKSVSDELIVWSIDWEQFSNTKLLNQIQADISYHKEVSYRSQVETILDDDFKQVEEYSWETGTTIVLSPTREAWPERFFKKVNINLQSIIPLTSEDKFDVVVCNQFFSEFNYSTKERTKDKSKSKIDFDYRIRGKFDGLSNLQFTIYRNEIDVTKELVELIDKDEKYIVSLESFWNRELFRNKDYHRADYDKSIEQLIPLDKVLKDNEIEFLSKLGKFSFDFYFMKAGKSDIEIVKPINISRRKAFFKNFSGIKMYRDDFKVRPYGDEGPLFDWIGLGVRAQKSPASVTHPDGSWRAEPYQVVGSVNLGRLTNPLLTDMANREGLAPNSEYALLVTILEKVFERFEYDRQYVFREFGKWRKQKIEELSPKKSIIVSVVEKSKKHEEGSKKKSENEPGENEFQQEYSKREYEEAILSLVNADNDELKTTQILMAFSSAGVMTNTFSHEISRISTNAGSRVQHLRESVKRILNYKDYTGDEDFNPFTLLSESENTDMLLSSWIKVIMDAVDTNNFEKTTKNIVEVTNKLLINWSPLMDKKYILFNPKYTSSEILLNISEVDIHLILNNFLLNSAWFLEDSPNSNRIIDIAISETDSIVEFELKNNGPTLDPIYKSNPNIIFNAGETSKTSGTGLGLWIVREVVNRYNGEVTVIDIPDGFMIKITFNK